MSEKAVREKILITVKTYPVLSRKYQELVCTAGVNEEGEWRRIYPVPFRRLLQDQSRYRKYQWIEADIRHSRQDKRPESYQIDDIDSLKTVGTPLSTAQQWAERRARFIDRVEVHEDLSQLISMAHENQLSLALFRPASWERFVHEGVSRDWDEAKIRELEAQKSQLDLFKDEATVAEEFRVVKKLPYKFSYTFRDVKGKESTLMVEDWEIGALYWNCLRKNPKQEDRAVHAVRQKYWAEFVQSGRYEPLLVLGTTLQYHNRRAPNPFVIIGVVPLPRRSQQEMSF